MDEQMDDKTVSIIKTIHEIKRIGVIPVGSDTALTKLYDTAFQHGRESLLKAAQELVGGKSILDNDSDFDSIKGQQALRSLEFLRQFMKLDPRYNRYDFGLADYDRPGGNNYRVTVWRKPLDRDLINAKNFWGTTDIDALANAAQSVAAEVEEARAKK